MRLPFALPLACHCERFRDDAAATVSAEPRQHSVLCTVMRGCADPLMAHA